MTTQLPFAIQEQQRRQRQVLDTGRDTVIGGERAEEALNRDPVKFARLSHSAGTDVPADPVKIGLLGKRAVVVQPHPGTYLVEQPRQPGRRIAAGYRGVLAAIRLIGASSPSITLNDPQQPDERNRINPLTGLGKVRIVRRGSPPHNPRIGPSLGSNGG